MTLHGFIKGKIITIILMSIVYGRLLTGRIFFFLHHLTCKPVKNFIFSYWLTFASCFCFVAFSLAVTGLFIEEVYSMKRPVTANPRTIPDFSTRICGL